MSSENQRKTAVKLLCRVQQGGAYSNLLLDEHFKKSKMTAQEKKFCAALFYGTLERRYTLDKIIEKYSSRPSDKLNCEIRAILETALYQLLYMDSVPESAAVNEAVDLASKNRNPAVKGYVNGLLRSFLRDEKRLPSGKSKVEQLSLQYSCPVDLTEKWLSELGEKNTVSLLADSLGSPPITVKVNTLKVSSAELLQRLTDEGFTAKINRYFDDCIDVKGYAPESSQCYKDGLFHVQDISSRLCCKAVDALEGMTVLDICSAPGGKTFTIAELMFNKGKLFSFDLHEKRADLVEKGAERLGINIVKASANNGKVYNSSMPMADRVLCDVPCSGLGVIRRKPEIKYKDLSDFDGLPEIQYQILDTSSKYVKPNGYLIYSTCTVSDAENRDNVLRFLKEHPDFELAPLWNDMGKFDGEEMLTVLPEYFNSDGFYIAKFKRIS